MIARYSKGSAGSAPVLRANRFSIHCSGLSFVLAPDCRILPAPRNIRNNGFFGAGLWRNQDIPCERLMLFTCGSPTSHGCEDFRRFIPFADNICQHPLLGVEHRCNVRDTGAADGSASVRFLEPGHSRGTLLDRLSNVLCRDTQAVTNNVRCNPAVHVETAGLQELLALCRSNLFAIKKGQVVDMNIRPLTPRSQPNDRAVGSDLKIPRSITVLPSQRLQSGRLQDALRHKAHDRSPDMRRQSGDR
jgi:hypothetical protein